MHLEILELKDKPLIQKYLALEKHSLSNFSFSNIFIWRDLFDIRWALVDDNVCIFFQNALGCFMYLPPLGKNVNANTVEKIFRFMDSVNRDKAVSRIENVEDKDLEFYRNLGLHCKLKDKEYLYRNADLINLSGKRYRTKRTACNYFLNNYNYEYLKFNKDMIKGCLELYDSWKRQRREKYSDSIYQQMLEDSFYAHKLSMDFSDELGLLGRVVRIDGVIRAYSFGYRLNSDTFCVLLEVSDLKTKGLAQFIFRALCSENKDADYINVMGDCGLDNLRKVKYSYCPYKFQYSYSVMRG
jgi:hypothetical protein